jgi:hypothetical protein
MFGEKPKQSVRGSIITARVDYAKHVGLNWKELLAELPPETQIELQKMIKGNYTFNDYYGTPDHFKRLISTLSWYPATLYNGFLTAIMRQVKKEKGISFEETARNSGRFTGEDHLKGFTAYVLTWGSIERTISLISKGWNAYFSDGNIRVLKDVPGEAQIEAVINYLIPEVQYVMAGYFEKVLEKKGAKDPAIVSSYTGDNGGTFNFSVKWRI